MFSATGTVATNPRLLLLSFTIAAPVLRADVTVRYKTEVHAQQLPGAASTNTIPPATILQIKGSKARSLVIVADSR